MDSLLPSALLPVCTLRHALLDLTQPKQCARECRKSCVYALSLINLQSRVIGLHTRIDRSMIAYLHGAQSAHMAGVLLSLGKSML